MKRTKCEKCGYEFANKGGCYNRHVSACNGVYTPPGKAENCKHCGLFLGGMSASLIANHMRWCADNPKHAEYKEIARQQAPKNVGRVHSKEPKERISKAHADGKYAHIDRAGMSLGRKHTDATKELLRIKALSSPHRRLRKKTIEYNGILLDSTWELALAKRLDDLNIKWIRPAPITWTDAEEKIHNYFPDFHLPDYNLYLDPKNPHAVTVQKKKLDLLLKQHTNIRLILTLDDCKTFEAPNTSLDS